MTLGGRDLREYRQEDVRRTFALAGQEAHLFDSTIRENLRLARPDATEKELHDALERARLDGVGARRFLTGSTLSSARRDVSSRAVSVSASCWRVHCSPTRPCWSSTSRPRTSTRRPPSALMDDVLDAAEGRTCS